jgi:hypothetical protein
MLSRISKEGLTRFTLPVIRLIDDGVAYISVSGAGACTVVVSLFIGLLYAHSWG